LLLKHKKILDFCMHELRIRHLEIFNGKENFCSVGNKRSTSVRTKKSNFFQKKDCERKRLVVALAITIEKRRAASWKLAVNAFASTLFSDLLKILWESRLVSSLNLTQK
jgi:hypothetical protein